MLKQLKENWLPILVAILTIFTVSLCGWTLGYSTVQIFK